MSGSNVKYLIDINEKTAFELKTHLYNYRYDLVISLINKIF